MNQATAERLIAAIEHLSDRLLALELQFQTGISLRESVGGAGGQGGITVRHIHEHTEIPYRAPGGYGGGGGSTSGGLKVVEGAGGGGG